MGHGITERDGVFTVREPAWHNLADVFPEHPTRKQAQELVHNWEPITEPVFVRNPTIVAHEHSNMCFGDCTEGDEIGWRYDELEDFKATVRSDTNEPLGVVRSTYEPVLNATMYDIAEALQGDDSRVMFETGGSLYGGRKVWLLLRLEEPLKIAGDPRGETIPYYGLQNDHTGGGSFRGQCTMTRIVCDNTSLMADMDAQARGTEFIFRHTRTVGERIEEAKAALAGWRNSIDRWSQLNEVLLSTQVSPAGRREFLDRFVPAPAAQVVSDRVMANIEQARKEIVTILESPTCEAVQHTAYGLTQAAIEYSQHVRKAQSRESRFQRAYLDRSKLSSFAGSLALEVANV